MSEEELKAWIDNASLTELLRKWRFAQPGDPFLQGAVGQHYSQVISARRAADPAGWVQASKDVGWG